VHLAGGGHVIHHAFRTDFQPMSYACTEHPHPESNKFPWQRRECSMLSHAAKEAATYRDTLHDVSDQGA